jgi:TolB-like protein/Flp pilus assembly protein TadD
LQAVRALIAGRGKAAWRLALAAVIIVLATAVAVRVFHSSATKTTPSLISEKSIAVLPLENLSGDPNNAYFADGIQEEILTRLASVADLKVISRTSTQRYQGKPRNLGEIAKQLGVANILEGSVQKVTDHVRVNVQLINAQTDSHLWAETYDRKLTDILGVESEIAKRIAESLQAKLSSREQQALTVRPTNNPEAYDAYLRGLAVETRGRFSYETQRKAIESYERAVQLDPNFGLAWARLSCADAHVYFNRADNSIAARADAARQALENAQRLEPDSTETLLTLGYYQFYVMRDYGAAKTTFERVSKMLPGNSEVPSALARITRREGHWDESVAYCEQALALDPRNVDLLIDAAWNYTMLRQFPAALKLYDRALEITPYDPEVMAQKASIYQAQGDLKEAAKFLSEKLGPTYSGNSLPTKITQWRLERNYVEAIRLLQARRTQFRHLSQWGEGFDEAALALMQRLAGDAAGAKITAEHARNILEPFYKEKPDSFMLAIPLSQAYAVMGEKDSAFQVAEHVIMLLPRAKDPVWGPTVLENLALIQTMFGENSRAVSTLRELLQTPYTSWFYSPGPVTPALLRLDPIWDPLRTDPAFQKLCEEKIDKSIAVLPLDNLSADENNAYFAEGIQEEILTRLSKIADLKVISRTSTQRYKGRPQNLGEIAKQLGVANILEGSVQRAADQVRVNVQLINAQTDSHLWADTYDRKITDIFAVESEIAKGVAESLQATLSPHEEQALAVRPTKDPEAYEAYLRGLAVDTRGFSRISQRKATAFYERAVQLDPNFALAWARLSRVEGRRYFSFDTPPTAHRDAAKRALDNAQRLDPDSPETMLALGYYQYRVLYDYGAATATFKSVRKMLPGNSEVPFALGSITRRAGCWDESIASFEQALNLDPRNMQLLVDTAWTYVMLRRFPAALKLYDRALDVTPNDPDAMTTKAGIYQAEGNLQEAARLLSEMNDKDLNEDSFGVKITQFRLQRNYGEAIRLLQIRRAQLHSASSQDKIDNQVALALTQHLAGDTAGAKATAEQARIMYDQLRQDEADSPDLVVALSQAFAVVGDQNSALKLAERAIMLVPRTKDAVDGPGLEENLAFIQTTFGESSRAISSLGQLLRTPYKSWVRPTPITPALLRLDPIWDPLRSDPAFQKLCEEKRPVALK